MMGLITYFAHRETKKQIKNSIDEYKNVSADARSEMIFYVWLTRGYDLAENSPHSKRAIDNGITPSVMPVYHYINGAAVPLIDYINVCKQFDNFSYIRALYFHYYTSILVGQPNSGYEELVRSLWETLFHDHTDLWKMIDEFMPILERDSIKILMRNNDVSFEDLANDVYSIMPHFLVPNHPLTLELIERDKYISQLGL